MPACGTAETESASPAGTQNGESVDRGCCSDSIITLDTIVATDNLALVLFITTVVRIIRFPWQNVLNISIADVGDGEYDSAVFLLQGSFQVGTRVSDAWAPMRAGTHLVHSALRPAGTDPNGLGTAQPLP